jgi:hypothetical protein
MRPIQALVLATISGIFGPMLTCFTKALRTRMAVAFIALYSLCILAPTMALAANGAPCLMEQEHGLLGAHVHSAGAPHEHDTQHHHNGVPDSHDEQHDSAPNCCGLSFFSAVAPNVELALAAPLQTGRTSLALAQDFSGLPPDKLIRPPKSQS